MLYRGQRVDQGTHSELLGRGGLYAGLDERPFRDPVDTAGARVSADRLRSVDDQAAVIHARAEQPAARLRAVIERSDQPGGVGDVVIERFDTEARAAGLSWAEIGHQLRRPQARAVMDEVLAQMRDELVQAPAAR